jgi:hypothetical protein
MKYTLPIKQSPLAPRPVITFCLLSCVLPSIALAGTIVAWGYNGNAPEPNTGFIAIAAGFGHSLGLKADGSIVAWGSNYYGQCTLPSPNTDFVAIACGSFHSLGLKQDGSIVAWGYNGYGQCTVPSPNTGFKAIATGDAFSLGLKQDGSIVAWGMNNSVPSPNTGFTAIAGGEHHSLGLKTDGSIVAWGHNYYGPLSVPEPNTGFTAIACGEYHSLGLKTDGSIVAWGSNYYGQCNVPEPNTGFVAIAAGFYHSLGLKLDGSIVAWGLNDSGQGNVPEPNTGFIAIAGGWKYSLGLRRSPFCDLSEDAFVDFIDYSFFAKGWQQTPDPCDLTNGDITKDNQVNIYDLIELTNQWLACLVMPATKPVPIDKATNVSRYIILQWQSGEKTISHDIYFGTDFNEVNTADITNLAVYMGNQDANFWDTNNVYSNGLNFNTTYYWRIHEIGPCCQTKGDVWTFTVESGKAKNPQPNNDQKNISLHPILSWSPGTDAVSHDVYFGTDFNIVNYADINSSGIYMGTQVANIWDTNNYTPTGLDFNTIYYWRIDEVAGTTTTKGDIWGFTTWPEPNIIDGLASWWKFDEGTGTIAYDSGGVNNGTIYGGTTWTTGHINGAFSFNGSSNYVDCGSGASKYDNITVSAWMKTSTNGVLVSNRYDNGSYGTWYTLSSSNLELGDNTNGGYKYVTFNTPTLNSAWHHIVYTKDGTNHAIYVDGSLDQQFTSNADISKSVPLYIGKKYNKTYDIFWFNGIIDDVRIYNRALSVTEVALLYSQQ